MWFSSIRRNFLADVVKDVAHGQFGLCGWYYGGQVLAGVHILASSAWVVASLVVWVMMIVLATWLKTGE